VSEAIEKDQVVGVECRFAVYVKPPEGERDDMHLVKEIIHMKDGRAIPNVRLLKNYKRPFWITRPAYRNHEDMKEWEELKRVQRYESTQTDLVNNIARALNKPYFRGSLRQLCRTPYIYGADILSTALIKRSYQDKFPDVVTPFTVSVFDTETDVVHGDEDIIMATVSFRNRVYTAVQRKFVEGHSNVEPRLQQLLVKYLSAVPLPNKEGKLEPTNIVETRGIKWEIEIVDSEAQVIMKTIAKQHEWKPDFMAIWNLDFDISKILKGLEKAGIDPKDVFCDERVPARYRSFHYKQGQKQKVTASGKVTPIKPAAQWHTVFCPTSFYIIDAMCAYRHIRNGSAEEPSYSLDAILKKHKLGGKLKFAEADHLSGLAWHQFMQKNYPLEYIIYNVFDCVSMELLDEETKDLSVSMPMMAGSSDFENFKSQPRRVVDELHHFVQTRGFVIGCTSDEMSSDDDLETVGLNDWIKIERFYQSYVH
jgi:DNA polymerase elongation subunit (family B)